MYKEDDMLMLSGIQHFLFCPRQWALIHIDQQWNENRLTTEGHLLHSNVDNPSYRQKNGDTITLRSVSIAWIETCVIAPIAKRASSRTPCGCVD